MKEMLLDYFYGTQAEQFNFYRLPKILITDKRFQGISSDAKILYGIMLDRMSLSMKNKWIDEENRVYIIFTLEDVMETFTCSERKASRLLNELDSRTGIGLIEKRRQGLGKPNIIYLKNFISEQGVAVSAGKKEGENEQRRDCQIVQLQNSQIWQLCDKKKEEGRDQISAYTPVEGNKQEQCQIKEDKRQESSEPPIMEASSQSGQIWQLKSCKINPVNKIQEKSLPVSSSKDAQNGQKWQIQNSQNRLLQSSHNLLTNKTDNKKTDHSKMDTIYPSFHLSKSDFSFEDYEQLIKKQIEYDYLKADCRKGDEACLDELVEIIAETLCIVDDSIRIGNKNYTSDVIRNRFMRLDASHIRYVMDCLHKNTTNIKNIKAYLLAALLNAPLTIDNAYRSQANYDLYAADESSIH